MTIHYVVACVSDPSSIPTWPAWIRPGSLNFIDPQKPYAWSFQRAVDAGAWIGILSMKCPGLTCWLFPCKGSIGQIWY